MPSPVCQSRRSVCSTRLLTSVAVSWCSVRLTPPPDACCRVLTKQASLHMMSIQVVKLEMPRCDRSGNPIAISTLELRTMDMSKAQASPLQVVRKTKTDVASLCFHSG